MITKGKGEIVKNIAAIVDELFNEKWSRNVKFWKKTTILFNNVQVNMGSRSAQSKNMVQRSMLLLRSIVFLMEPCNDTRYVIHSKEYLSLKLEDQLVCLETVLPGKLVKRYMTKFLNEYMIRLLSMLENALIKFDHHELILVVQFIIHIDVSESQCLMLQDEYGLFADVPDADKSDTIWYIWYLIILYIKTKVLQLQRNKCVDAINIDQYNSHWLYMEELVQYLFTIYKTIYGKITRHRRILLLVRLIVYTGNLATSNCDGNKIRLLMKNAESEVDKYCSDNNVKTKNKTDVTSITADKKEKNGKAKPAEQSKDNMDYLNHCKFR